MTLEEINFSLKEKKEELKKQNLSTFTLNKKIKKLILEIAELEEKKELALKNEKTEENQKELEDNE